jgi:hypothetical protein
MDLIGSETEDDQGDVQMCIVGLIGFRGAGNRLSGSQVVARGS